MKREIKRKGLLSLGLKSTTENKLKKAALECGYLNYGGGGVSAFSHDLLTFCADNETVMKSFIESQKSKSQ